MTTEQKQYILTSGNLLEGKQLAVPHGKIQRANKKINPVILFGFGKF